MKFTEVVFACFVAGALFKVGEIIFDLLWVIGKFFILRIRERIRRAKAERAKE